MKISKVIRVGNSLAITIPVAILRSLKIKRGDYVVFGVYDENVFAVRKVTDAEQSNLKPGAVEF